MTHCSDKRIPFRQIPSKILHSIFVTCFDASLSKFVRLAGDLLLASRDVMFVVVFVFEVSLSKFVRLAGSLLPASRDVMLLLWSCSR